MSRIEEALRRSQLAESEPVFAPDPPRFMDIEDTVDAAPLPLREAKPPAAAVRSAPVIVEPPSMAMPAPGPAPQRRVDEKLVISPAANAAAVEQYRKLAAALHQLQVERGIKIVMVASAMAGEGKTLTAAN